MFTLIRNIRKYLRMKRNLLRENLWLRAQLKRQIAKQDIEAQWKIEGVALAEATISAYKNPSYANMIEHERCVNRFERARLMHLEECLGDVPQ